MSRSRLRLPHLVVFPGAFERTPRLREEHVVEARLVEAEVGDANVLPVEGAHHLGEARGTAREPGGDGAGLGGDLFPEFTEDAGYGVALRPFGGRRLDARASYFGLQRFGRVLGHDPAAVDDPDPV